MEGPTQRAWQPTSPWCPLMGHLRPSSDMANSETLFNPIHDPWVAKPPTRLRHGLSSGPRRNAAVHTEAPGIQARRHVEKDTSTQIGEQRVRTEASGSCMEQIHGPRHERNRFQAEFLRSMSLLSRKHRLPGLHRRLLHFWSQRALDRRSGRGLASVLPSLHC